jgi:protein-tyrosine phosphatase
VAELWDPSAPGIVRLPSGRLIRGRSLRRPLPDGTRPAFAVYLLGQPPPAVPWESRWLRWPDFRLPDDRDEVLPALTEAWQRAPDERVEVACTGGHGRTGTALACLAIIDGVPSTSAVAFVRAHYDRRAVETFRQRRYVAKWQGS